MNLLCLLLYHAQCLSLKPSRFSLHCEVCRICLGYIIGSKLLWSSCIKSGKWKDPLSAKSLLMLDMSTATVIDAFSCKLVLYITVNQDLIWINLLCNQLSLSINYWCNLFSKGIWILLIGLSSNLYIFSYNNTNLCFLFFLFWCILPLFL